MIGAVVPVKTLPASKSRLSPWLDRARIEQLAIAMLGDVIETLQRVRALDRIAVATPDPRFAEVARSAGVEVIASSAAGLNPAVEDACAQLAPSANDAALVLLGDVAGARAADIEELLAAGSRFRVVTSPSNDGGTSALLRSPRDVIPAAFGPESARAHRQLAERAGASFAEIALPSLAIDIDSRADVEKLATSPSLGARTRALLSELLPDFAA